MSASCRRRRLLLRAGVATLLLLPFAAVDPRSVAAGDAAPAADAEPALTHEQIEALVAPVALYPDVVLGAVLPASTVPLQVVQAGRLAARVGAAAADTPEAAAFEPSVRALLQYPQVLQWMSDHLDWVEQLGYAVATRQPEVLRAVQTIRAKASAAGTLVTTPQLTVVVLETHSICLVPSDPEVVYVPVYDPVEVVAVSPGRPAPGLAFAAGVFVGAAGAWALHELVWDDDDFFVYVHRAPIRWDATFVRDVELNVRVRTGDITVRAPRRAGSRWQSAAPVRRPATLPAAGSSHPAGRPAVATPRPPSSPGRVQPAGVGTRPPSNNPVGPVRRPGDGPAATPPAALDVGPDSVEASRRGRTSLDGAGARAGDGPFGGMGAGPGASRRGARSLELDPPRRSR